MNLTRKPPLALATLALCVLALLVSACTAPASPGTPAPGAATPSASTAPDQPIQKNTSNLPTDAAVAACTGKTEGDSCQFSDRGGTATGTCDMKPGVLACAPATAGNQAEGAGETATQAPATAQVISPVGTASPVGANAIFTTGTFVLRSEVASDGGTMPDEYSCDGAGASPALSWSGAPVGTKEYTLMMTTIPVDGSTRWNWVLYHIPGSATGIARNGSSIGILGTGSHGTVMQYDAPCSQGPGAKLYTFTLYALSGSPELPANPEEVTGPVLTNAISSITLDKAVLDLNHARAGQS